MEKTTNTTINTGSVAVIASYDSATADTATFDIDTAAGYIYLLQTGIYAMSSQFKWTTDPSPVIVHMDVSSSVQHPYDATPDIATFQQYGPTGHNLFRGSCSGTVVVSTLSGTPTNNYVRLRAGHTAGSDRFLDTVTLMVVRLGSA